MKRGTPEHPKMLMLQALLGIEKFQAVGILECLWHWASRYAIQGDVGKWPNKAIALGIGWNPDDADRLVDALVQAGWLDLDFDRRPRVRVPTRPARRGVWTRQLRRDGHLGKEVRAEG